MENEARMETDIKSKYNNKQIGIFISGIIAAIICIWFINYCRTHSMPIPNSETAFWLYSTSAQTVATFVAFIIAGYAIYNSMLNDMETRDESLIEIIKSERNSIFGFLKDLAIMTVISITLNLYVILMNGTLDWYMSIASYSAILSTFIVICIGSWIVIYMIDPKRKEKIARKMVDKNESFDQEGQLTEEQFFFSIFIRIERKFGVLANRLIESDILNTNNNSRTISFRNLIGNFYNNGVIDKRDYIRLIDIYKYKNLLFHGKIEKASVKMVGEAKWAEALIDNLSIMYCKENIDNGVVKMNKPFVD